MTTSIMTYHGFKIMKTHSNALKCWHYYKDEEGGIADSFQECIDMIDLLIGKANG